MSEDRIGEVRISPWKIRQRVHKVAMNPGTAVGGFAREEMSVEGNMCLRNHAGDYTEVRS
jgi:hypothetical protein